MCDIQRVLFAVFSDFPMNLPLHPSVTAAVSTVAREFVEKHGFRGRFCRSVRFLG